MDLVHWHEGLFLQPHHLQMLQQHGMGQAATERRLAMPFPYGLVESRLNLDALNNSILRFDRLAAVMPSGLYVNTAINADLPPLDIKQAFQRSAEGFVVGLGVPLWNAQRANVVEPAPAPAKGKAPPDDSKVKRLWRLGEVKRADENTGEGTIDVITRRVNARLVIEGEDHEGLEVLPLVRVVHGVGDDSGVPRRDGRFIPTSLVLGGSKELRDMLRDLANQTEASRKDIVFKLQQSGFNIETARGPQWEDMLRLRTLNVYSARLTSLMHALGVEGLGVTPFHLYMEMRSLLSELAALHPDRDPWDAPKYDHDDPAVTFFDLDEKIRGLLRGVVKRRFQKVEFVKDPQGFFAANLTDEHLKDAQEFFLGIAGKEDPTVLARLVEDADKFKLMPKSMWKMTFYGVKLQEDRAPQGLPSKSGLYYFRLNKAETRPQIWEQVIQQKGLAARWPDAEGQGIQDLTLYITYA
jgi:type VI secretion system ImpJ/VasE family protein